MILARVGGAAMGNSGHTTSAVPSGRRQNPGRERTVHTSTLAAIDFGGGVSSAWTSVANFVPKLVAFLVIFFIGWIIARVLAKVVERVLRKVGFDSVVERGGMQGMLERSKYDASGLIAKVVYYAILLIALEMAFGVFGANPISNILTSVVGWLPKLI